MNHNFKLKSGETFVTNDAELLNYALKSALEEPDEGGTRKGKATFHHVARRDSAVLVIRCRTTHCPHTLNLSVSFSIFNGRDACRETIVELSRTPRLPFTTEDGNRSAINHPFVLPFAEASFFLSSLRKVFNIRDSTLQF